jgi:hypothetical protein
VRAAWIFSGSPVAWFPKEAFGFGGDVGPLTEYPVDTGLVPMADLYWSPKLIICSASYSFFESTAGGAASLTGDPRCNRARELVRAKDASFAGDFPVFDETGPLGNNVHIGFESFAGFPRSKYLPGLTRDRHYPYMVCNGRFEIGSSVDNFSSLGDGDPANFIGYCEVVANPGKQSVFLFPLYRSGPVHLAGSIRVQITRQSWGPTEL